MDTNIIDKDAHYFMLMHPLEGVMTPWFNILYTSSMSREKWVECEIDESEHQIEDGYKIKLRAVEEGYGSEKIDIVTFLECLEKGFIVKKTPGLKCVEESWIEPLTKNTYLHHSAYVLKK